jgi:hypothetical protein
MYKSKSNKSWADFGWWILATVLGMVLFILVKDYILIFFIWLYEKIRNLLGMENTTNGGTVINGDYPNPGAATRGLRNNNPGNIKIANNAWTGKIPVAQNTDKVFEQFTSMAYGIRASFKLLDTYLNKGFSTIEKIVGRWDKPNQAYVDYVTRRTGIAKDTVIVKGDKATHIKLMSAMFEFENAKHTFSVDELGKAYDLK